MNVQNIDNTPKANPSFGAVKLYGGAKEVIKKVLKPKEIQEAADLFEKRANDFGDTIFWGKGENSKKLTARVISENKYVETKDLSQHFWESTMKFIKRVCKKADDIQTRSEAMGNLNPDDTLKNF